MSSFAWASALATAMVVLCAWLFRSRSYALARGLTLVVHSLIACALEPHTGVLWPAFYLLHATVYAQSLMLVWARLRPVWFVALVSVPGLFFASGMLLAFPWAIAGAFGLTPYGWWLPFALAAFGVWQSLTARTEETVIVVSSPAVSQPSAAVTQAAAADAVLAGAVHRHPKIDAAPATGQRPLRIVQITDPHLGPFMSVERLRKVCERAVARQPDLIVLTGDFLTMESQADAGWLGRALQPLLAAEGKVFACLGNHDHEALDIVRNALDSARIRLLVDEATLCNTPSGLVQIVGFDFHWRKRSEVMAAVCAAHPRYPGALRLALLHDPGAFKHLPAGEAELVLSGHTHGGQLGLVSFNHPLTIAGAVAKIPDHGLWARGSERLYVHRGTGHYGFPLRLGVPAEESVLVVYSA